MQIALWTHNVRVEPVIQTIMPTDAVNVDQLPDLRARTTKRATPIIVLLQETALKLLEVKNVTLRTELHNAQVQVIVMGLAQLIKSMEFVSMDSVNHATVIKMLVTGMGHNLVIVIKLIQFVSPIIFAFIRVVNHAFQTASARTITAQTHNAYQICLIIAIVLQYAVLKCHVTQVIAS